MINTKLFFGLTIGFFFLFSSHSFSQTCSDGILNNGETSVDCGGPNCDPCCDGRRPDLMDNSVFSSQDRADLAQLIIDYLQSQEVPNWPLPPVSNPTLTERRERHPSQRWVAVATHSGFLGSQQNAGNWHSNDDRFFTWHRNYIQELEDWLLSEGHTQFVPLPAWNPADGMPAEFLNVTVDDYATEPWPQSGTDTPMIPMNNVAAGALDMYDDDDEGIACNDFTDIDDYAGFIRANSGSNTSHNQVHVAISGAMGIVATASGAAIFWVFHAYVDEQYYCYQEKCQNLDSDIYVKDDNGDTGAEPSSP